jgi:hypothetical protein
MRHLISVMFLVVAVIHLLPVTGVLGSDRRAALYGISLSEPNLTILMRHRAVLFGILGLVFVVAAFNASLQPVAFGAGVVSVLSFLWIARSVGGYNAQGPSSLNRTAGRLLDAAHPLLLRCGEFRFAQLDDQLLDRAGENERYLVVQAHRGAGVLADVEGLVE